MSIIKNSIRCNICKDVVESTHVHDYVKCKCGRVAADGGREYLRRSFTLPTDYEEMSIDDSCDDAVSFIRVVGEELVIAGYPGGDRAVILANIRKMIKELAKLKNKKQKRTKK